MKIPTTRLQFFLLFLALSCAAATSPSISRAVRQTDEDLQSTQPEQKRPLSVPGEILVRFRSNAAAVKGTHSEMAVREGGREIKVQIESFAGPEIVSNLRLARVSPADTSSAIAALAARADVLYAEPNFLRYKEAVPNDPRYGEQFALKNTGQGGGFAGADIKAEPAWDITTGSRSVVVGVVDQGIDINHADLKDNIWKNPAEIPGNGVDDDANGFVDDLNGWDFVHNDNTVFDGTGIFPNDPTDAHGTHVAGIIGATGNNGVGIAGVNWQVSILSLKFLGPVSGTSADLLRALSYAKMMRDLFVSSGGAKGANLKVLNNSYGGGGRSQAELDAITALNQSGILFVVAAGNSGRDNDRLPEYPSNYNVPNVISVAATSRHDFISNFSNYGSTTVAMGAPGEGVLSTTPNGTYSIFSGTSMASPHVAGAAALVFAASPDISLSRLRASLMYSGDLLPSLARTITGRRLNLVKSLQAAFETDSTPPADIPNFRITSQNGRSITLAWTAPGDDGSSGTASAYEIRFSDSAFANATEFQQAQAFAAPLPVAAGGAQTATVKIPYRHPTGVIGIRAVDNVGNTSAISSVPVSIELNSADPYIISETAASPLSTGGTPLGLIGDDKITYSPPYQVPFDFPFFGTMGGVSTNRGVVVSTNGVLYLELPPATPTGSPNVDFENSLSTVEGLRGYQMIAGAWDDLRTDRRAGDDVYVVRPDPSRVIFRWQAVTNDFAVGAEQSRGENPVNFEIEIQRDGTIITRYGDGNQNLFPVVGISNGELDTYPIASHTSESSAKDLTNAATVVFTPRVPASQPSPDLSVAVKAQPNPVSTGQQIFYTVTALNYTFGVPGEQTVVNAQLPSGMSFVSCYIGLGSCTGPPPGTDGGTVTANFGTLNYLQRDFSFIVKVTAAPGTALTNSVSISNYWADPNTGNNSASVVTDVLPASSFGNVTMVSAGGDSNGSHTLSARSDGTVWSWGYNTWGQLGDGTRTASSRPVPVPGLSSIIAVSAGEDFSLALKSDGTVWAWGNNSYNQLGFHDQFGVSRINPGQVPGLSEITAIAAGGQFALALRSNGTVWAWGNNVAGQLGNNSPGITPLQIAGLSSISSIGAGQRHSLAVDSAGSVWAWGSNLSLQLGQPTSTLTNPVPQQLPNLGNGLSVSGGQSHSLLVKRDGTVWAWGSNSDGLLGNNGASTQIPQLISSLSDIRSIDAGSNHNLAIKGDGTLWAWGSNLAGQLGNGATPNIIPYTPTPTQVAGVNAINVSGGPGHSVAVLTDGTVMAWGNNRAGQLGDGTDIDHNTPTQVTGIQVVATPSLDPGCCGYFASQIVTIGCPTPGAVIHYTFNGADPTINDLVVASGTKLLVDHDLTIKARAFKDGAVPSQIAIAGYTIFSPNPINDARNFVRQHYLDFLNRNPDTGGWDFWTGKITQCGLDSACIHSQRIGVSAAFFIELEFQQTGYVVYRFYRAAYGTRADAPSRAKITFQQFIADRALLVGGAGLPQNTINLANNFVERPEFKQVYPDTITKAEFVNLLFDTAGLVPYTAERQQQIDAMTNNGKTRAQVLLDVIAINEFKTREYNPAFVLMQYYGYLRRNPDQGGYDFWLNVLTIQPSNFRGMVCSFLTSTEYQRRFGTSVTRSNQDCQ